MQLGICKDGRPLSYDAGLYEFSIGHKPAELADVHALDARGDVRWRAVEMRDWFVRIDAADLAACHKRALEERFAVSYDELTPEQRVQADAARDDSVIAGKIVDADPALVHAVANSLIEQGLLASGPADATGLQEGAVQGEINPLAVMDLPRGMEPLSQLERMKGSKRKMTRSEQRLMKKILKNDDKEKERRERRGAAVSPPSEEREPEEGQER